MMAIEIHRAGKENSKRFGSKTGTTNDIKNAKRLGKINQVNTKQPEFERMRLMAKYPNEPINNEKNKT